MKTFFKTLGRGLLTLLLSPLWVLFFALSLVYSFLLFFVQMIKAIVYFFQGKDYSIKNGSIDKKAEQILFDRKNNINNGQQTVPNNGNQFVNPTFNQINNYGMFPPNMNGSYPNIPPQQSPFINNPYDISNSNNKMVNGVPQAITNQEPLQIENEEQQEEKKSWWKK